MANTVEDWIGESTGVQQFHLEKLRELILAEAPDAKEAIKWGQPCFSRKGLFCYLQRAKNHVTLGFQKGARMSDPDGLLEGEGSAMRHVKFAPTDTLDESRLSALIREALRIDG